MDGALRSFLNVVDLRSHGCGALAAEILLPTVHLTILRSNGLQIVVVRFISGQPSTFTQRCPAISRLAGCDLPY